MITAVLYAISGFVSLWIGILVLGICLGELKKYWHLRAGVIVGVCSSVFGLYMVIYVGLLGVIRAIIDYAKQ